MATIQGVYVALFGRPADPLGLAFFVNATNNGADLTAIGDLSATAEYQDRFAGMTDVEIINSIYQSLFNRDADLAGLTFFVAQLQSGAQNINTIAINILDGAQGTDLETVNNKIEAANNFTAALDTGTEVVAYSGNEAAAAGRAYLAGVTNDDSTIPTPAETDAAIQAIVDGTGTGDNFTLTTSIDAAVGTSLNDTFTAALTDDASNTTYNTGDSIDGGDGRDTLRIIASSDMFETNVVSTTSIEVVEVQNFSGTTLDLNASQWSGVDEFVATGNNDIDIENVNGAFSAVTFRNFGDFDDLDIEVANSVFAGSNDTLTVNLENAGSITDSEYVDLYLENADGDDVIENLAVNSISSNAGGNYFWFNDADVLDGITVSGSANLQFERSGTDVVTSVDASAMTGNLTWTDDFAAAGATFSYVGSQGKDVVEVNAGGADITINLGAGNDGLIMDNGAGTFAGAMITLGAGSDSLTFTATINNVEGTSNAALLGDVIKIADFNGSEDTLDLAVGTRAVLTNVELAAAASASNLAAAINVVLGSAAFDDGEWASFQFAGNTYVYSDLGDAAETITIGDGLVELTGFTGALNASNFVA